MWLRWGYRKVWQFFTQSSSYNVPKLKTKRLHSKRTYNIQQNLNGISNHVYLKSIPGKDLGPGPILVSNDKAVQLESSWEQLYSHYYYYSTWLIQNLAHLYRHKINYPTVSILWSVQSVTSYIIPIGFEIFFQATLITITVGCIMCRLLRKNAKRCTCTIFLRVWVVSLAHSSHLHMYIIDWERERAAVTSRCTN